MIKPLSLMVSPSLSLSQSLLPTLSTASLFGLWCLEIALRTLWTSCICPYHPSLSSAFVSSFFGHTIDLTSSDVYDIFNLSTYFQCPHLKTTLMEILPSKMTNWDWSSMFLTKCVA
ncbi:hypothetical protein GEMRC1_012803 [Eukaryota sp. GEM-RC1]